MTIPSNADTSQLMAPVYSNASASVLEEGLTALPRLQPPARSLPASRVTSPPPLAAPRKRAQKCHTAKGFGVSP